MPPVISAAIKPESARATLAFFASDYGKHYLARLAALKIDPVSAPKAAVSTTGPLVGAGCVLTGSLSRPRTEFAERITRAGGIVQSAVSKNTKYLIAGANVGSTKTDKARALGTQVIDEATLESMLAAAGVATTTTASPATNPPPAQPTLF